MSPDPKEFWNVFRCKPAPTLLWTNLNSSFGVFKIEQLGKSQTSGNRMRNNYVTKAGPPSAPLWRWSRQMLVSFLNGIIVGWLPSMIVLAWTLWRVPIMESDF